MENYKKELNTFLVDVFNDILRLEEASLIKGEFINLSINEIHVIVAVCDGYQDGSNSMTEIANKLLITASTLTTSVKTLEQKGYLMRSKLPSDKRKVMVTPSSLAHKVYKIHKKFHDNLVDSVTQELSEDEMASLTLALSTLHGFFKTIKI